MSMTYQQKFLVGWIITALVLGFAAFAVSYWAVPTMAATVLSAILGASAVMAMPALSIALISAGIVLLSMGILAAIIYPLAHLNKGFKLSFVEKRILIILFGVLLLGLIVFALSYWAVPAMAVAVLSIIAGTGVAISTLGVALIIALAVMFTIVALVGIIYGIIAFTCKSTKLYAVFKDGTTAYFLKIFSFDKIKFQGMHLDQDTKVCVNLEGTLYLQQSSHFLKKGDSDQNFTHLTNKLFKLDPNYDIIKEFFEEVGAINS